MKKDIKFVLYNLAAAIVIVVLLIVAVFVWLGRYTQHGVEQEVPMVCGADTAEAYQLLNAVGLKLEVIDSTYSQKVPLGTIVEQNPQAGSHAKHGRAVYVIVNARQLRQVPVPDVRDLSYRQAQASLTALGLKIDTFLYEPSEYRDLVLDLRLNGVSIEEGTRLPEGTAITLIVGQGKGTEQVYVPNLIGKTLEQARETLLGARLVVGAVNYDVEENNSQAAEDASQPYLIYKQQPSETWIVEGSRIDLYLSTDPKKAYDTQSQIDDEEFF